MKALVGAFNQEKAPTTNLRVDIRFKLYTCLTPDDLLCSAARAAEPAGYGHGGQPGELRGEQQRLLPAVPLPGLSQHRQPRVPAGQCTGEMHEEI